jgi:uncharacterized glyoxalase superfamily protein PhnB
MPVPKAPSGYRTITPRIFAADPSGLVTFLRDVFGATGEFQPGAPAELTIGDSMLLVSGTDQREALAACLYVYVDDLDATYKRAIAAGAISMEEPRLVPYGDRRAMVTDNWGNTWQIAACVDSGVESLA